MQVRYKYGSSFKAGGLSHDLMMRGVRLFNALHNVLVGHVACLHDVAGGGQGISG